MIKKREGVKTCFVFCHGFAFDASYWKPLQSYFSNQQTIYWNLGYCGEEDTACNIDESVDYIGVGHSLGLIKLLTSTIPFKALIGLHGFIHFLGFSAALHRQRRLELGLLTRQLTHSPEAALSQFYQRVGVVPNRVLPMNQMYLLRDLELLNHPVPFSFDVPLLILGSKDDKIVPPALIEDNFADHPGVIVDLQNQGLHGLGHLKPDVVHQKVMRFLYEC